MTDCHLRDVAARLWRRAALWAVLTVPLLSCSVDHPPAAPASVAREAPCAGAETGLKHVYWGDLHVHTAYSLDAYGYGTLQTPADAFRFGKGQRVQLSSGPVQLARPLDFMAVTDHAEWLDVMYICSDPTFSDNPVCKDIRAKSSPSTGARIFRDYVNPTITLDAPQPTQLCREDPKQCEVARDGQWARVQSQANSANEPCRFTAFVGFEWSGTPGAAHNHRNVIFRSEKVTPIPVDYIRYPRAAQLWDALSRLCRPEDGCDAVAIPHNMDMGDGLSFDVETEDESELALRARYERLVEVIQEKGASECLPPYGERLTSKDCTFEAYVTSHGRPKPAADFTEAEWEKARSTYARGLLRRGLLARAKTGRDPLQVGFVGSTDTHTGLGGFVDENEWQGTVFGLGDFDRNMSRLDFNPGGVVGVWAEQNTRAAIFDALRRREVYASSGPRIALRFHAASTATALNCSPTDGRNLRAATPMGGMLPGRTPTPAFRVEAIADQTPIDRIEIVKGSTRADGGFDERVEAIWTRGKGEGIRACAVWRDPAFDARQSAYWYARVIQAPTPRWSAVQCRKAGRCAEFPGADRMVEERAWASPIWYAPG